MSSISIMFYQCVDNKLIQI